MSIKNYLIVPFGYGDELHLSGADLRKLQVKFLSQETATPYERDIIKARLDAILSMLIEEVGE